MDTASPFAGLSTTVFGRLEASRPDDAGGVLVGGDGAAVEADGNSVTSPTTAATLAVAWTALG